MRADRERRGRWSRGRGWKNHAPGGWRRVAERPGRYHCDGSVGEARIGWPAHPALGAVSERLSCRRQRHCWRAHSRIAMGWREERGPVFLWRYAACGLHPVSPAPAACGYSVHPVSRVNQRGRFRFKGGCFDCHQSDGSSKIHAPHSESILIQCGVCHNAHGSTAKALLLYPKETACRQCHD
jgi:predicted CXXCH cytochrome family protein